MNLTAPIAPIAPMHPYSKKTASFSIEYIPLVRFGADTGKANP